MGRYFVLSQTLMAEQPHFRSQFMTPDCLKRPEIASNPGK